MVEYEIQGRVEKVGKTKFKYKGGRCEYMKNIESRWINEELFEQHLAKSDEYNNMVKRIKEYIEKIRGIFEGEEVGATLELKLNLPLKEISKQENDKSK